MVASPTKGLMSNALLFSSRRSAVICRTACVASSQPLASALGYDILKQGGNAADAAITIAAALAVTEPCSTGLGGDMFCLWYDSNLRKVSCINGSGKSPSLLNMERVEKQLFQAASNHDNDNNNEDVEIQQKLLFSESALSVTVPGCAQGWHDLYIRHGSGKFTFAELLEPAALLAEQGFPVAPITAYHWALGMPQLNRWAAEHSPLCPFTGRSSPPTAGELVFNPHLARVLRELGHGGPQQGFYEGPTGKAIVDTLRKYGGCMTQEDLSNHESTFPEPISVEYRHCRLWQAPPNGQGIAGLIALAGLSQLEKQQMADQEQAPSPIGTVQSLHAMIEMMRLGFADARAHVSDPTTMKVTNDWLLNSERIGNRVRQLFDPNVAKIPGIPDASSCTVSFQVVDALGNAISLVNSNFQGFGTGIVPLGCGFTLQNRGAGFTLARHKNHPNALGPHKRPYHTIIPGLLTHADTNELYATISNMGGLMQPQGHLQLTVALLSSSSLDPQTTIDLPRFCIADGTQHGTVYLEEGMDETVVEELKKMGHSVVSNVSGHDRSVFGRAQIIMRDRSTGVLWAGSDGRADGCAMGF